MIATHAKSLITSLRTRTKETLRTRGLAPTRSRTPLVKLLRDSPNPPLTIRLCSSRSRKRRLKKSRPTSVRSLKLSARMTQVGPLLKIRMPTGKQATLSSNSNRPQASITATRSLPMLGMRANNLTSLLPSRLALRDLHSRPSLSLLRSPKKTIRMVKIVARLTTLAAPTRPMTKDRLVTLAKIQLTSSSKMTSRTLPTTSRTQRRPARSPE